MLLRRLDFNAMVRSHSCNRAGHSLLAVWVEITFYHVHVKSLTYGLALASAGWSMPYTTRAVFVTMFTWYIFRHVAQW